MADDKISKDVYDDKCNELEVKLNRAWGGKDLSFSAMRMRGLFFMKKEEAEWKKLKC